MGWHCLLSWLGVQGGQCRRKLEFGVVLVTIQFNVTCDEWLEHIEGSSLLVPKESIKGWFLYKPVTRKMNAPLSFPLPYRYASVSFRSMYGDSILFAAKPARYAALCLCGLGLHLTVKLIHLLQRVGLDILCVGLGLGLGFSNLGLTLLDLF
jgi:hypothetical protein